MGLTSRGSLFSFPISFQNVKQGSVNFYKGPDGNYFRPPSYTVSVGTAMVKVAIDHALIQERHCVTVTLY